jgi:hypothetical protein
MAVVSAFHDLLSRGECQITSATPTTMALYLGAVQMLKGYADEFLVADAKPPISATVDEQCPDVWNRDRCVKKVGHAGMHVCNGTQWASDEELEAISATGEVELPPLDVTEEDRHRAERVWAEDKEWGPVHQLVCRERQLFATLRQLAERDKRIEAFDIALNTAMDIANGKDKELAELRATVKELRALNVAGHTLESWAEMQSALSQAQAKVEELQDRLKYATHFFDSPASFSHAEFAAVAEQVYGGGNYHGKVPHLDELCALESTLQQLREELEKPPATTFADVDCFHTKEVYLAADVDAWRAGMLEKANS